MKHLRIMHTVNPDMPVNYNSIFQKDKVDEAIRYLREAPEGVKVELTFFTTKDEVVDVAMKHRTNVRVSLPSFGKMFHSTRIPVGEGSSIVVMELDVPSKI